MWPVNRSTLIAPHTTITLLTSSQASDASSPKMLYEFCFKFDVDFCSLCAFYMLLHAPILWKDIPWQLSSHLQHPQLLYFNLQTNESKRVFERTSTFRGGYLHLTCSAHVSVTLTRFDNASPRYFMESIKRMHNCSVLSFVPSFTHASPSYANAVGFVPFHIY